MKNGYIIDHAERAIIITKEFAKRASNISTREYRELTSLHRDFPDYTIERRTAEVNKATNSKQEHNIANVNINSNHQRATLVFKRKILQVPALTLCNSANGGKALIFRRFRHLPFGRVLCISRRIPA